MARKLRGLLLLAAITVAASGAVVIARDYADSNPSPDDLVAAVAPGVVAPAQQAAFADGEISFDEYRQAVFANVECLVDRGFRVDGPPVLDQQKRYQYAVTFPGSASDGEFVRSTSLECYQTYLSEIDKVWSAMNAPSPGNIGDARRALASCLREKGIAAPADPQPGELGRLIGDGSDERYWQCAEAVSEEFGLPGFAG